MPIIIRVIPLLIVLFAAPLQAAGVLTQSLPAVTLNLPVDEQVGALLKAVALPASAISKLQATQLSLMTAGAPWDAPAEAFIKPPSQVWV
ncbi:hypothetical protein JZM24_03535 [Candidatus Sodalis endolongispinus]|uniref:Uncharacterized protein n=1 Tax=Candidatus Sodalis endolongispinus TaxID=2812662 RepID=A0ABS5Y933_9GAMM|nr:hypothetical protein [Candidatus Sodalis endolongispinus]MBT9431463.1 hypothetical protein [Candidatus Sodalis endolongispinus]